MHKKTTVKSWTHFGLKETFWIWSRTTEKMECLFHSLLFEQNFLPLSLDTNLNDNNHLPDSSKISIYSKRVDRHLGEQKREGQANVRNLYILVIQDLQRYKKKNCSFITSSQILTNRCKLTEQC